MKNRKRIKEEDEMKKVGCEWKKGRRKKDQSAMENLVFVSTRSFARDIARVRDYTIKGIKAECHA